MTGTRELRLRHDVEFIASVYDAAPVGLAVWTDEGRLLHANPVFCQLVGREPDELAGVLFESLIDPGEASALVGRIADLWAGRRNFVEADVRCTAPGDRELWLRAQLVPVYGPEGEPEYLISHIFSFAGRPERDPQLHRLAHHTPVMLWLTDTEGRARLGNRTCFEFLGASHHTDDLARVWVDAMHPRDLAAARAGVARAIGSRRPFEFVARSRRRDGTWRWLHHRACPVFDGDGGFEGYAGASLDVTDNELTRAALRDSQRLFETISEAGPVAVVRTDTEGRITYMNGRWDDIVDRPQDRLPDFGWRDIIRPEDVTRILEAGIQSVLARSPFTLRVRAFDAVRSGDLVDQPPEFWGELRAAPVFDADGDHTGFVATLIDVSAEVAAKDRADRLAQVLDASLDYVLIALPTGAVTYLNDAAARAFEVSARPTEPDALFLWDLLDRESVERYYEIIEPMLHREGVWRGELTMLRRSGSPVPVSAQLLAHRDGDRLESVSVVARDITELKAAEEQLRHLATHDKLTGLANRALLYDRLDQALARAQRWGREWRSCTATWTASSRSTTSWVTTPVTPCWSRWRSASTSSCVTPTPPPGSAVTSSWSWSKGWVTWRCCVAWPTGCSTRCEPPSRSVRGRHVSVSVSVGLVLAPEGCTDADELMNLADRVMYRAKAAGRDRVEQLGNGT